jgi:hypothetical protein
MTVCANFYVLMYYSQRRTIPRTLFSFEETRDTRSPLSQQISSGVPVGGRPPWHFRGAQILVLRKWCLRRRYAMHRMGGWGACEGLNVTIFSPMEKALQYWRHPARDQPKP